MASYNNNNLSKISQPYNGVRSRSPDPYHSSHKRNHSRRHTLPTKFQHHPNFSHPYYPQHTHHLCNNLNDDSIDTSTLNQGILFYQDSNGETNFYLENELETCSPSLMPESTDSLIDDISGDSIDLEEKYFQIMAKKLNKRKDDDVNEIQLDESPAKDVFKPTEDIMDLDDPDVALSPKDFIAPSENSEFDLEDMVKEMNELLSDANQEEPLTPTSPRDSEREGPELSEEEDEEDEEEQEEPPSPTSPRDPERDGPVLSEEEENTEEGIIYRFEHDPEFQDEAGLDDNEGQISDDEGIDPMENH